jgi:hypothetical protein
LSQLNQRKLNELKSLNEKLAEAEAEIARWEYIVKQIDYQRELVNGYLQ